MKKFLIVFSFFIGTALYGATVSELQNKEKELYSILSEYWIDKAGDTHVGNKDVKELQFAFSESLMSRFSIKQIIDSMTTAIAKFDQAKKDAFAEAVEPYLNELTNVRIELKNMRDKMDKAASLIGQKINKSPQDVMKMSEANIRNLINKTQDLKIKFNSSPEAVQALKDLIELRSMFGIQAVEVPIKTGTQSESNEPDNNKIKSSSSGKLSAAANAVAKSETKLSSLIKASATLATQGTCQDIHFDIVPGDKPGSVIFLRLIK